MKTVAQLIREEVDAVLRERLKVHDNPDVHISPPRVKTLGKSKGHLRVIKGGAALKSVDEIASIVTKGLVKAGYNGLGINEDPAIAPPLSPDESQAIAALADEHAATGWPGDTTARLAFTAGAVAGYFLGKDKGI